MDDQEKPMDSNTLTPAATLAKKGKTPFPGESDAYRKARETLLAEEIEFRRHMTRLADERRALPPGPLIVKNYRFKDANGSDVGLIDLFGKHDALVTYFWMYGPQRERPCPMCTNWLGAVNGNAADIKQRVALKILGRSSVERQSAFASQRSWRHLDFVQTVGDEYANDLGPLNADERNGGPGPRPTRSARRCFAMVNPRLDARRARHRLVSEVNLLRQRVRTEINSLMFCATFMR
jgi:hypothetical protein